jgi:hypothetical protein
MSIRTLTTYATMRNVGSPTAADSGEAAPGQRRADEEPKISALLAKMVPTEVLGPYIALIGVVSPHITPERSFIMLRWLAVIALAVWAGAWTWLGYERKAGTGVRKPLLETSGVVVAALGLALSMPASPLYHGRDPVEAMVYGSFMAAGALAINSLIAQLLKKPAPKAEGR